MAPDRLQSTLVIMAASREARFGGMKQLAPVGPHGETIMEYSIRDAIASGFSRIVLVVRRDHANVFQESILDKVSGRVETAMVFQELNAGLPQNLPAIHRTRPWGTAHAVMVARYAVSGPFAVLNADDFYGPTAFTAIAASLGELAVSRTPEGVLLGYPIQNTLSDHGTVSRGVCGVDQEGYLTHIVEHHKIARNAANAIVTITNEVAQPLVGTEIVSMNLWGFQSDIFSLLEQEFARFVDRSTEVEREFEIPTVVNDLIAAQALRVRVLDTNEKWCGLTYRDDLTTMQSRISQLIGEGIYANSLY